MYWLNVTGLSITEQHLAETNFKILNNVLPYNGKLRKWGKRGTNLCYFCQQEESISHLLYYCTRAIPIWDLIQNLILVDNHNITHDMVVFGYDTENVINHLLSITIYIIFIRNGCMVCSLNNLQRKYI